MFVSPFSHLFSFFPRKNTQNVSLPRCHVVVLSPEIHFFLRSFSVLSLKYISDGVSATLKFNSLLEPIT